MLHILKSVGYFAENIAKYDVAAVQTNCLPAHDHRVWNEQVIKVKVDSEEGEITRLEVSVGRSSFSARDDGRYSRDPHPPFSPPS